MPISPQHIAPPINSNTVGEFCKQIDDKLQNPLQVSTAIVDVGQDLYKADFVTLKITVLAIKLNASEKERVCSDYVRAGWKTAEILEEGNEPGRGYYTTIMLRTIPQTVAF